MKNQLVAQKEVKKMRKETKKMLGEYSKMIQEHHQQGITPTIVEKGFLSSFASISVDFEEQIYDFSIAKSKKHYEFSVSFSNKISKQVQELAIYNDKKGIIEWNEENGEMVKRAKNLFEQFPMCVGIVTDENFIRAK